MRAIPISTNKPRTMMDFALWQIALERRHFSCGTIDGDFGMRSRKSLRNFQRSRNLPVTGELDSATRFRLGKPGVPFTNYVVTEQDLLMVYPTPRLWRDKAQRSYLGYNTRWEMLAERFHTTPKFLMRLNRDVESINLGTELLVPNLGPSEPLPKAGLVEIIASETTLLIYDSFYRLVACFPCSIASAEYEVPTGKMTVAVVVSNPNYTYKPDVIPEIAEAENLHEALTIPPGPNNPVGLAWIGLSKPGYGIHGTPEPSLISVTGSHGCFRLANWNAIKLFQMVEKGTPVVVRE